MLTNCCLFNNHILNKPLLSLRKTPTLFPVTGDTIVKEVVTMITAEQKKEIIAKYGN